MHELFEIWVKAWKRCKAELVGETTEVDKNVVHLTDPLMHIIRNSMDHE